MLVRIFLTILIEVINLGAPDFIALTVCNVESPWTLNQNQKLSFWLSNVTLTILMRVDQNKKGKA